ncbi:MAG TPA: tyrosine-type recombinase/integrase [Erysipelothrix sp.]
MNKRLLQAFIDTIAYLDPRSQNTVQAYAYNLSNFVAYLETKDIAVTACTKKDITNYLNEIKADYAPASLRQIAVSIRQFYQYLLRFNYMNYDPSENLVFARQENRLPKVPRQSAIEKLLNYRLEKGSDYMDQALLLLMAQSGLRVSEAIALKFNNVYEQERWIRILGKGNKERMIPISQEALKNMQEYVRIERPLRLKSNQDLIFLNTKGKALSRQYVYDMIQKRRTKLGIKEEISPHMLRHYFATRFLEEGVDLKIIQDLLGHSDITTTQIYTHLDTKTLKNEYDTFLEGGFLKEGVNDDEI